MNKTVLIVLIVVGGLCVICGGGAAVSCFALRDVMQAPIQCAAIMDAAHQAIVRYAEKNGKLPDAKNWQSSLAEFLPRQEVEFFGVRVPAAEEVWVCNSSDPQTGVAFNSELSGKAWSEVAGESVILFELPKTGVNQSAIYRPLPPKESPKVGGSPRGWFVVTKNGVQSAAEAQR